MITAINNNDIFKAKILIEKGASINEKYNKIFTVLSSAIFEDHEDIIKLLIEKKLSFLNLI